MITEHFCDVGRRLSHAPFFLVALMAGLLLCGAASAQPGGAGRREREAAGPLERLRGAAAPAPAAPETVEEPEESAPPQQNYEQLPADENLKRNFNTINGILMAGKFAAGQQQAFDDYYQKFFLARWTDPKNVTNLPAYRKELRNSHLGKRSAAPDVHEHLNALLLDFMKKLAAGPYHPAVQVNAMLMIGELNSVEQPPTPLPEALAVMIAALQDAKLPDALRAAALVGIHRHVAAGIPDAEARRALTAALVKAATEDIPAGLARAGREWIRRQAIEILGLLGSPGENNAVFQAMAKSVADSKLRLSTRAVAAESLGRLNYAGAAFNPAETAAALAQFVLDACSQEVKKAKDTGYPISRRRLQQCLTAARSALAGGEDANRKGIVALAPPAQQALLADLPKSITATIDKIDKWQEGDDLEGPVDELQASLEAWLKKKR